MLVVVVLREDPKKPQTLLLKGEEERRETKTEKSKKLLHINTANRKPNSPIHWVYSLGSMRNVQDK